MSDKNLVILGLNWSDAHNEYRRLVAEDFGRVMGVNVLVRYPNNLATLEGLRVHDLAITERATQHLNYEKAHDILRRCLIACNYTPRQETSD